MKISIFSVLTWYILSICNTSFAATQDDIKNFINAALTGQLETVKELVESNKVMVDDHISKLYGGQTALMAAVYRNPKDQLEVVEKKMAIARYLIEQGADIAIKAGKYSVAKHIEDALTFLTTKKIESTGAAEKNIDQEIILYENIKRLMAEKQNPRPITADELFSFIGDLGRLASAIA